MKSPKKTLKWAAIAALLQAAASPALAQSEPGTIGAVFDKLAPQARSAADFALAAAFAAGLFFVGMGLARLKAASDSQGQQVRYGEGVWRIAIGCGMAAIPAVIVLTQHTFGLSDLTGISFANGFAN